MKRLSDGQLNTFDLFAASTCKGDVRETLHSIVAEVRAGRKLAKAIERAQQDATLDGFEGIVLDAFNEFRGADDAS